jgi:hypothetical protein
MPSVYKMLATVNPAGRRPGLRYLGGCSSAAERVVPATETRKGLKRSPNHDIGDLRQGVAAPDERAQAVLPHYRPRVPARTAKGADMTSEKHDARRFPLPALELKAD